MEVQILRHRIHQSPYSESEILHLPGCGLSEDRIWDDHILKTGEKGHWKVNGLSKFLVCRDITSTAKRAVYLQTTRPALEYGAAVWDTNTKQRDRLEAFNCPANDWYFHYYCTNSGARGIWNRTLGELKGQSEVEMAT